MIKLADEPDGLSELNLKSDKPSILDIFKNRSYMLVYGGQISNFIALILSGMTFSYLVYSTTENAALMSLMGVFGSLSAIIMISFAGIIVDRFDQRKLILITTILRLILVIGLLVIYLLRNKLIISYTYLEPLKDGVIQRFYVTNYIHFIWPLYTLNFLNGMVFSTYNLTINTYVKYIVKKKDLLVANSFSSAVIQLASVVAPILTGLLITTSYFYSFLVSALFASIPALLSILLLHFGKKTPKKEQLEKLTFRKEISRLANDMKVGYRAISNEPKVLFALIIFGMFNLFITSINGTYDVVLQGEMKLNATWYGSISTIRAVFGILTSLIFIYIGKINRKVIIIILVCLFETVGLFLFTFIRDPWLMLFLVNAPFGFVNGAGNIPAQTLRQEKIPHEKLGRATSFVWLITSIANLIGMSIITSINNKVNPMYILLTGSILFSVLTLISIITIITKRNLQSSDYQEEIVKVKKHTKILDKYAIRKWKISMY